MHAQAADTPIPAQWDEETSRGGVKSVRSFGEVQWFDAVRMRGEKRKEGEEMVETVVEVVLARVKWADSSAVEYVRELDLHVKDPNNDKADPREVYVAPHRFAGQYVYAEVQVEGRKRLAMLPWLHAHDSEGAVQLGGDEEEYSSEEEEEEGGIGSGEDAENADDAEEDA